MALADQLINPNDYELLREGPTKRAFDRLAMMPQQAQPQQQSKPFYDVPERQGGFMGFLQALAEPFTGVAQKRNFNRQIELARELGQQKRQLAQEALEQKQAHELQKEQMRLESQNQPRWQSFNFGDGADYGFFNPRNPDERVVLGRRPLSRDRDSEYGPGRALTPTAAMSYFQEAARRNFPEDTIDANNKPTYSPEYAKKIDAFIQAAYQGWLSDPTRNAAKAWLNAISKPEPPPPPQMPWFMEAQTPQPPPYNGPLRHGFQANTTQAGPSSGARQSSQPQTQPPQGMVKVRSKNGQVGFIPAANLEAAKARGATVIE